MEILLRVLGAVEILICWLTAPLYYLLKHKTKPLPAISHNILRQSATELARKIRTQEYTCEQVVRAFVIRCNQVNPKINAIVEDRFNQALLEAHTIDEMFHRGDKSIEVIEKETPLLGVPFTVKESVGVKGMSQSVGCLPRKGIKATQDGWAVANLRKAGAIPIAVTNTPELCLCWETNNLITGCTNNPYDSNRTPGGSSGGEAALVSASGSVVGVASDVAGSIRLPAAFTGVFGHKPTPGIISLDGHFPNSEEEAFNKFLVVGPMTRYACDLKPIFKAMAGEKASLLNLDEQIDFSKVKIMSTTLFSESLVNIPTDKEIKEAVENATNHFNKKYGCPVEKLYIDEMNDAMEICLAIFFQMKSIPDLLSMSQSDDPKVKKSLFVEFVKSVFGLSEYSLYGLIFTLLYRCNGFILPSRQMKYVSMYNVMKKKFLDMLEDNGVFILPTHPTPAYYHGQYTMKTAGVLYTMLINILGMPSTQVPMGLNRDGLPIGIQVVAAPGQDRLCLALAEELGKVFGGWVPPL